MKRETLMKNNTKLIMETWRRFLKEDVLDDEPSEGYFDDEYNPEGFNPDDEGLDNPIDGEPPFDHAEPPEEDGIMADDDYDEVFKSPEYDELPYTEEDATQSPEQKRIAREERYDDDLEYDSEDYRPEDFEDSEY